MPERLMILVDTVSDELCRLLFTTWVTDSFLHGSQIPLYMGHSFLSTWVTDP